MTQDFDKKLIELGIALPEAAAPVANYVPAVQVGKLLYVSGQIPMRSGQLAISGKAGIDVDEPGRRKRRGFAPSTCWRKSRRRSAHSTKSNGWCGWACSWPAPTASPANRKWPTPHPI